MAHSCVISLGLAREPHNVNGLVEIIEGAVARTDDSVRVKNLTMIVETDHPEAFMRSLFDHFDMIDFRWINLLSR